MKVALYPRVSSAESAKEGYSIGEQTERLKKYCEAMSWNVHKIYTDPGYSGATLDRPGLQALIKDVKAGKVDKVVVYKLDRLSRSQKDTLYLIEDVFLANNTDFVSITENFDTSSPFGIAMIGILSVFAQLEREKIKERMIMGREARAKKGLYSPSKNILIGYDYIDGLLQINPYEKMIVNEAFDLFVAGTPLRTITTILNEKGLTHHYGEWSDLTIRRLLSNRHYIGEVKYQKKWYPGVHTPIVETGKFNKAQEILKQRRESYHSSNTHSSYLGGLIWCGRCGARYHPKAAKPRKDGTVIRKYKCYSRSKRMAKMIMDPNCQNKDYLIEELEEAVFNEIRKLALDPDYLTEIREERSDSGDDKISLIQKEIAELSEMISAYMDMYPLKRLTLQEVDAKIEPLADRREKLEDELAALLEDEDDSILSAEDALELVRSFDDILDRGNFDEIRKTLTALIERIFIDGDVLRIHWNFR